MYAVQARYWRILYRVEQDMEDMYAVQARYWRILYRVEKDMEDMYREKQFKYIIYSISIKSIFTFKFFLFIFLQHTTQHQYLYKQSRIRYKG